MPDQLIVNEDNKIPGAYIAAEGAFLLLLPKENPKVSHKHRNTIDGGANIRTRIQVQWPTLRSFQG